MEVTFIRTAKPELVIEEHNDPLLASYQVRKISFEKKNKINILCSSCGMIFLTVIKLTNTTENREEIPQTLSGKQR